MSNAQTLQPGELLSSALTEGRFIQCTLSRPRSAENVDYQKVTARLIELKAGPAVQLTFHFPRKETHKNFELAQAASELSNLLERTFEHGHLFASDADFMIRARRDGSFSIKQTAPTKQPRVAAHDRTKQYLLPEGAPCPFLIEIGVMTADGKVRAAKRKKFRQINRYLEIVNDVVNYLPDDHPLRVVDFGCGKSYLTFALHHLLTVVHDYDVQITGLDREPSVVETCSRVADKLNCRGLEFQAGEISRYTEADRVDLAVSLHACDTATDDAIAAAVGWDARVILAVPCCQHELAPVIQNAAFDAVLEHGILKERFAALVTDALRAAALEVCGYETSVIEFIDMEHTAKNVLLRATRKDRESRATSSSIAKYLALKEALGIRELHLERVLPQLRERI